MPYGDRTGPVGAGPMTGRRTGYCVGFDRPGRMNPSQGFSFGTDQASSFGGHRRGWRHTYQATGIPGWARGGRFFGQGDYISPVAVDIPPQEEAELLKNQARNLENNLKELQNRLAELQGSTDEE